MSGPLGLRPLVAALSCLALVPVAAHIFKTVEIVEKSMLYARTEVLQQQCCMSFYTHSLNHTTQYRDFIIAWETNFRAEAISTLTCSQMLKEMDYEPCLWLRVQRKGVKGAESPTGSIAKSRYTFMQKAARYMCKCIQLKQDKWIAATSARVKHVKSKQDQLRGEAKLRTKASQFGAMENCEVSCCKDITYKFGDHAFQGACSKYNQLVPDTCQFWYGLKLRKYLKSHAKVLEMDSIWQPNKMIMHENNAWRMCRCISLCEGSPDKPAKVQKEADELEIKLKSAEEYLSPSEQKTYLSKFMTKPTTLKLLDATPNVKARVLKTVTQCLMESCTKTGESNFKVPGRNKGGPCQQISRRRPMFYPCLEYEKLRLAQVSGIPFMSKMFDSMHTARKWCENFHQCSEHIGDEQMFPFEMTFINAIKPSMLGRHDRYVDDFSLAPTQFPTASPTAAPTAAPTNQTFSPTAVPTPVPTVSPTAAPTKKNMTAINRRCVTDRCIAEDLHEGIDMRVPCERLYTSMVTVNIDGSPCKYYETLMWHEAYRPQTKDPIFREPAIVLKLCRAFAMCVGDFSAMQKTLQRANHYKKEAKERAAKIIEGRDIGGANDQTEVGKADRSLVKHALQRMGQDPITQHLFGATQIEVKIVKESKCQDHTTKVHRAGDTVRIVGRVVQFSRRPSVKQAIVSLKDSDDPSASFQLAFDYGAHNVIEGIEMAVRGICFNQTRTVLIPPALIEEIPADENPMEHRLHLQTDSWTAMSLRQTFHSYLWAKQSLQHSTNLPGETSPPSPAPTKRTRAKVGNLAIKRSFHPVDENGNIAYDDKGSLHDDDLG